MVVQIKKMFGIIFYEQKVYNQYHYFFIYHSQTSKTYIQLGALFMNYIVGQP